MMIKRLLFALLVVSSVCGVCHAQDDDEAYLRKKKRFVKVSTSTTPAVIQYAATPNMANVGQPSAANATQTIQLPRTTQAGDAIIVVMWYESGTVWSVTDTVSDTFTRGAHCFSGAGTDSFYIVSGAGGARTLTVKHTTGSVAFFAALAVEVNNLTAFDTSSCTANTEVSDTVVTAGSLTPCGTCLGDFILQFAADNTAPTMASPGYSHGSQSNITWQLIESNLLTSVGAQFGVYNSVSAINPTLNKTSTANGWSSLALAFKAGAAGGSLPTGEYVVGHQSDTYQFGNSNPYSLQITPQGTSVLAIVNAGAGNHATSITSSPTATWTIGTNCVDVNTSTNSYYFYATGLTANTTYLLTVTQNANGSDSMIAMFDVAGASTIDTGSAGACNTGTETGTGALNTSLTTGGGAAGNAAFTPSVSSGIVFAGLSVSFNTVNALSTTASGGLIQNGFLSTNSSGNTPYYENDGLGTFINSATSGIQFTWSFQAGLGANVGDWSSATVNLH